MQLNVKEVMLDRTVTWPLIFQLTLNQQVKDHFPNSEIEIFMSTVHKMPNKEENQKRIVLTFNQEQYTNHFIFGTYFDFENNNLFRVPGVEQDWLEDDKIYLSIRRTNIFAEIDTFVAMTISCHFSVYLTYKDIQEKIRLKMF